MSTRLTPNLTMNITYFVMVGRKIRLTSTGLCISTMKSLIIGLSNAKTLSMLFDSFLRNS